MNKHHFVTPAAIATVAIAAMTSEVSAQNPQGTDTALRAYRPPRIALVQPAEGVPLQQDIPVVVVRFAAGEPGDPVDVRSFAISVDAKDQTNRFQVSSSEAWGPIASSESELALGSHEIATRICSARGACASVAKTITVAKPAVSDTDGPEAKTATKKRRLLDALLAALRSLLKE